MPHVFNRSRFIQRSKLVFGDKFGYDKVEQCRIKRHVTIICKIHGPFQQSPANHLRGYESCSQCKDESKVHDTKTFIKKSESIFGKRFDYSETVYSHSHKNVKIICSSHGPFEQLAFNHFNGRGCPNCTLADYKQWFFSTSASVHHGKYDYSRVDYVDRSHKVTIICPTHGEFSQRPDCHANGQGCSRCRRSKMEEEAEYVLKLFGLEYQSEFPLPCRDVDDDQIRKLKCDFMFKHNKQICIVELDGEQHHRVGSFFKVPLYEIIRRDRSKNLTCLANGYHLLRISWKEKEKIESWISRFLLAIKSSTSTVFMVSNPSLYNAQRDVPKPLVPYSRKRKAKEIESDPTL